MKLNKFLIKWLSAFFCAFAFADDDSAPQVYQPTYIYGATPAGVYMGNMYDPDPYDGLYMPDGEPMQEYQTQSGEQEQAFQYMQGQEELMADHSKEDVVEYNKEQVIGNDMENKYQTQIDAQTNEAAPQPIVLPSM